MRHARDGRFLGRDLLARGIDRQPVVAVVDCGDHIAAVYVGVVGHRNACHIAGDLGSERRVVGLHISVVGRHQKAPNRQIVVTEPAAGADGREQEGHEDGLAAAGALCAHRRRRGGREERHGGFRLSLVKPCQLGLIDRLRLGNGLAGRPAVIGVLVAIHALHSCGRRPMTEPFSHYA